MSSRRANKRYLVRIGGRRFFRRLSRSPVRCRFCRLLPTTPSAGAFSCSALPSGHATALLARLGFQYPRRRRVLVSVLGRGTGGWLVRVRLSRSGVPVSSLSRHSPRPSWTACASKRAARSVLTWRPPCVRPNVSDMRYVGSVCLAVESIVSVYRSTRFRGPFGPTFYAEIGCSITWPQHAGVNFSPLDQ